MTLSTGQVLMGALGTTEGLLKRIYADSGHHVVHSGARPSRWLACSGVIYPFLEHLYRDWKMLRFSGLQTSNEANAS